MMKILLKLIVFGGLIVLLLGIGLIKLPASWALQKANPESHDLSYARASGTLWRGEAEQVKWRQLLLGEVNWTFLTLDDWRVPTTTWSIEGNGPDYEVSFLAEFARDVPQQLQAINGEFPAGWIDLSAYAPLLFLDGRFDLNLNYLQLRKGAGALAEGSILWKNAGFKGLVDEKLGSVEFHIESEGNVTHLYIHSPQVRKIMVEGAIDLNARRYDALIILHTTEEKRYVIEKLADLGTIRPDGALEIKAAGRLTW